MPSISPECHNMLSSLHSPVLLARKPPTFLPDMLDQTKSFKKYDMNDFKDINSSLRRHLEYGYVCTQYEDYVFFKLLKNELSIPEVSECIRIDKDLHVKLFYKGSSISTMVSTWQILQVNK